METTTREIKDKAKNFNETKKEGPVAKGIEEYTARIPSDIFLWAALGAMAVSATFKIMGRDRDALFVGQWAPSFLLMGNYNKIVKVEGHD